MNIWIINHYAGDMFFDKGGRHYAFAKYLKRMGYDPVIFCCNAKHGKAEHFFKENFLWQEHRAEEIDVPFVFVKGRTYVGNGKQRVLNMMDFYRNVQKAAKEYAKTHGKPDVIYASSVHPLTIVAGIHLAKYFGVKCVGEVRDLWPESIVAYGVAQRSNSMVKLLYQLEKWIYRKSDAVIFTMEGGSDYIVEKKWDKAHGGPVELSKIYHINNGVDLEQFNYNKEHFKVTDVDLDNPDLFKVVYTGSIRKVNYLGLLLDAAKQVTNPRIKFLIWGDGDELPALRQRAADEKIGNVVFKGRVEKKYVPYIVSHADLNIAHNTPSPLFRFGVSFNKLFDYFAAGKPVLWDFPSKYNPAELYKAGLGSKTSDPQVVAATVERFSIAGAAEYTKYCENAQEAANHYNFAALTRQLLEILKNDEKREG